MANRALRLLGLDDNSIGDEGAAALARALATNCSLETVCAAPNGWGASTGNGRCSTQHARASPPRHSSVVVAQLLLGGNSIDDAGISALVGALAANDTLTDVCDGAAQRCGLHVRVLVPCPHWLCTARAWQILCWPSSVQHVERCWCACACARAGCTPSQIDVDGLPQMGGQLVPRSQQCPSHASCRSCSSGCPAAM